MTDVRPVHANTTAAGKLGAGKMVAGGVYVSHVAHLAGAFAGVVLIFMISRLPSVSSSSRKSAR